MNKLNIRIDCHAYYDVINHRKPKFPDDDRYMDSYHKWRKYFTDWGLWGYESI